MKNINIKECHRKKKSNIIHLGLRIMSIKVKIVMAKFWYVYSYIS